MNITISNSSSQPIYEQIYAQIRKAILMGELLAGEEMPSLRFLAKELRVSIITTKRAYDELERDGYLHSVPGRGTFVADTNLELVREQQLQQIEEDLQKIIERAALIQLDQQTLIQMLNTLYNE